jgi:hypothetical protein
MALNDFNFNPPEGWNNETEFPDYPQASEVRPLFQKLFDQIKVYLGLVKTEITTHEANDTAHGIGTHLADLITDADGAHGFKVSSGTFTPVILGQTTAGNNTYFLQVGNYYVLGKLCYFDLRVELTAKDAAMAGAIFIGGLPFTSKNTTNRRTSCIIGGYNNFDVDAAKPVLAANIVGNDNKIGFTNNGDSTFSTIVLAAQIIATTEFRISGCYEIA